MKKIFLIAMLGAGLGLLFSGAYRRQEQANLATRAGTVASAAKTAPAESQQPGAGYAREFGGRIEDAGIVALIKGKYVLDHDLASLGITVDCNHGRVVLSGSAASPALILRATDIARQTRGVTTVSNLLVVRN